MREMSKGETFEKKEAGIKKRYVRPSVEFVELRVEERISGPCATQGIGGGQVKCDGVVSNLN